MSVRIIVDSTADLQEKEKMQVTAVPLTVCFGTQEYVDGVTINHTEFYEKLVESDVMPSTSQATPDAFEKVFREVAEAGDSAVVLTLASKLSGTYQSAMIAAGEFENIHVVDTASVAIGSGILTKLALALREQGLTAAELAQALEQHKKDLCIVTLVDTLEYLKKGGRLSGAAAFAGKLLNIKPVLAIVDGEILVMGKARGAKQGAAMLASQIEKLGGVDFTRPVMLGYTGTSEAAIEAYRRDGAGLWAENPEALPYTVVGSVIGTHIGPGVVAVAFFKKP
ncbi:MAG: DegV family protein [Oscillospiraceae bacterium]|nr:DegV family protein [Oscillospiraceae bacterium]